MNDDEFHVQAERLIENFDAGELTYEEFDDGYEVLLAQFEENV